MRKELTDQIRACSVLYGAQLEDKDIQRLQEMAAAIGINDKDTLFILLVLLQSHFKAVSGLKDEILTTPERVNKAFDIKVLSGITKLKTLSKRLILGGVACVLVLVSIFSCAGGYMGSQQFSKNKKDSQIAESVQLCVKNGGSVQLAVNTSRLACFAPDGSGKFIE